MYDSEKLLGEQSNLQNLSTNFALENVGKNLVEEIAKNEKERIKTLIYVRHGTSEWNKAYAADKALPENIGKNPHIISPNLSALTSIKTDIEMLLAEEGIEEAKEAGKKLVEYFDRFRPEHFFSSECFRAIETRKHAIEEMERIYGELFSSNIQLRELNSLNEESSRGPEGSKLGARAEAFLATLDEEFPKIDTIVVFGHRNWYKTFLQQIHNWTPEELKANIHLAKLKNGQIALHQGTDWRTLKRIGE